MIVWNGISKDSIVFYNDKEYRVIVLYESDNKKMCRMEKADDDSIVLDVYFDLCEKKGWKGMSDNNEVSKLAEKMMYWIEKYKGDLDNYDSEQYDNLHSAVKQIDKYIPLDTTYADITEIRHSLESLKFSGDEYHKAAYTRITELMEEYPDHQEEAEDEDEDER